MFDAAPARLVSAKDWALARMRARIYSGEFQSAVKLSIDSLATELRVSRTPIRDALGQLEREGLVTLTSRVGVVRRLTRSEAEDICRIKEVIEPLMARWAAERPSAAQRAEYRDAAAPRPPPPPHATPAPRPPPPPHATPAAAPPPCTAPWPLCDHAPDP